MHEVWQIVGDKDAAYVKFDVAFAGWIVEVPRAHHRAEEEGAIFHGAFGVPVCSEEGFVEASGEGAVEFGVLLLGEFGFLAFPDSAGAVGGLAFAFGGVGGGV